MIISVDYGSITGGGSADCKYEEITLSASYDTDFHTDNYILTFGSSGAAKSYCVNGVNTDVGTDSRLTYSYNTTTQILNIKGNASYNCYLFYNDLG